MSVTLLCLYLWCITWRGVPHFHLSLGVGTMKLSAKESLYTCIREEVGKIRETWDKKVSRYNDVAFAYRVIQLMSGPEAGGLKKVDQALVKELVSLCDKSNPNYYQGGGPLNWAWTWAIPTTFNLKRMN